MRTLDPTRGQQILDTAAQLFARQHYHEVRMEDIASSAGVAKGTLYRYFADKEDLYLALTVHGMQRLFEESQDTVVGPGQPEEKLRAFITGLVGFYERYPYFLELWARVETSRSVASMSALQTIRAQFFRLLTGLITEINAAGRHRTSDPQLAAWSLLGIIRGVLRFNPQPWPEHLADWIYDQFVYGLSKEPR